MDSDDSNYIDSDTEAYLYSQIYHETQGPKCDDTEDIKVINNPSSPCDVSKEKYEVYQKSDGLPLPTLETSKLCPKKLKVSPAIKCNVFDQSISWSTLPFVANDRLSVIAAKPSYPGSPLWTTLATSSKPNLPRIESDVKPTKKSQLITKSVSNARLNPVIEVLRDQELKAEKPNRTRPVKRSLTTTPKLTNKCEQVKKIKLSDDSTDSDEVATRNWVESGNANVVIHVNPSTNTRGTQLELRQEDNPYLWSINTEDRYKTHSTNRLANVMCYNCRERGHLSKSCKKPKRMESCYLCGEPGHKGDSCPRPVCGRCLLPGHWQYQCHWAPNKAAPCALCNNMGHLCQECPSIWRRYHLTTSPGPIKTVSDYACQTKTTCYCYTCGREGHYGYACPKKKRNTYPLNRVVTRYDDPRRIIFHKANVKLWRKRLSLSGQSDNTPQLGLQKTKKQLIKQHNKAQRLLNKKRKKKEKLQNKSGAGDIIRINPAAESNFPRTVKKGKNVQGMTLTCWKTKNGKNILKRTVFHNSIQT